MLHLQEFPINHPAETWLSIGTFDGVHLGHQALIRKLVTGAHNAGAKAAVVTFYPHPAVVLGKRPANISLSTPEERASCLEKLGVDILVTQQFDSTLASTSARDYILVLKRSLNMVSLWVGHDFALGHNREGDIDALRRFGQELGYNVNLVGAMQVNEEVVSSSQIRKRLWSGEVDKAAEMLGRPYSLSGTVIRGDQRGRTIGIPTANLDISPEKLIPARGVYACLAVLSDRRLPAATNIGVRPTFDGKNEILHVETHILDFSGDLYGKTITLEFIRFLRSESRFENVKALIDQIQADIQETRTIVSVRLS
jgi:riboflavin kinase / FMN adenylyltransferase